MRWRESKTFLAVLGLQGYETLGGLFGQGYLAVGLGLGDGFNLDVLGVFREPYQVLAGGNIASPDQDRPGYFFSHDGGHLQDSGVADQFWLDVGFKVKVVAYGHGCHEKNEADNYALDRQERVERERDVVIVELAFLVDFLENEGYLFKNK
ncbi:MAG: hypothetical protein A2908_00350 [Candidatus Staskawiczbacteria bacterium RIFCSPLOWO2_01_FULL_38_12b]|uniref:Uncharacterized protein n=1 Tax=Candidatus Staskawiczbacteria bacterium RIFCSPLOWO2_01_FULL_38_12b TaxID=1802214 RepID=A0A1G2IDK8_9BACT|nr:MAG: hypothetical protein A2908_00350 [Candidatus Staskawiczbacteria bacterium RIFCSPLOWO2_01_FULL_38_12b]